MKPTKADKWANAAMGHLAEQVDLLKDARPEEYVSFGIGLTLVFLQRHPEWTQRLSFAYLDGFERWAANGVLQEMEAIADNTVECHP